ncbi:MAG: hypothetical protein J2P21_16590 [Chloracidobacterium sp.]|nr:hypothetical protein [Chloracidobacterium sp.]
MPGKALKESLGDRTPLESANIGVIESGRATSLDKTMSRSDDIDHTLSGASGHKRGPRAAI